MSFVEEITEIFHSSLGVEPPGPDVDLIATGVLDSLSIVGLITALESRYAVQIPLEQIDLDSIRTTRGIQALIESERVAAAQPAFRHLVLVRSGVGRPVFLPHNSHGSAATAQPLARVLRTSRPLYAFQADYDGVGAAQDLPTLAAAYVEAMRGLQPQGPYTLAGHSFAGLIAYEMARQTIESGGAVDLLGMVDTQADVGALSPRARIRFRLGGPLRWARYVWEDRESRLPEVGRKVRGRLLGRRTAQAYYSALPDAVGRAAAISDGMEASYRPPPYPGDAVLLIAQRRPPGKCRPDQIWSSRIRGRLRIEPIPGAHGPVQQDAWDVVGELLSPLVQ